MIHWLAWLTIGLMLGLAAMQSVYVALYMRCLRRTLPPDQQPDPDWKPPAGGDSLPARDRSEFASLFVRFEPIGLSGF